ncbi:MAG: glycosyltransferase [Flavobacterium sp.]|nr:MAG: glycosyltransferase [Flavobacterium sp.]
MTREDLLVISLSNSVGGAERCLKLIALESGCPIVFLFRSKTNVLSGFENNEVKYISSMHLFFGFLMLPLTLYRYRKFTIISSHSYVNAVLGILARFRYLKGKIISRESTSIFIRYKGIKKHIYSMLYRAGYPALHRIICQSYDMADQLSSHAPYLKGKIKVVPNPIDFDKAILLSKSKGPFFEKKVICAAGRLIPIKGFDLLIKAFSDLSKKYPDYMLLILGVGPMLLSLNKLIDELGISEKVSLIGYQSNPYAYFRAADICIVPSILEGFPNVLLEMMAVNDTVVTTLCAGGIAEIPGIITVKPQSVAALTLGLETAIEKKTNERDKIDSYLKERSPEMFLQKIMVESEITSENVQ